MLAPLAHHVTLAQRQHVLGDECLEALAGTPVLVCLLARLARVQQLHTCSRECLEELGEYELLVGLRLWVLLLRVFLRAVDAPKDVVDLRDRDRAARVLHELHPLTLRHGEPLRGRLGSRTTTLRIFKEEPSQRCQILLYQIECAPLPLKPTRMVLELYSEPHLAQTIEDLLRLTCVMRARKRHVGREPWLRFGHRLGGDIGHPIVHYDCMA